PRETSRPPVPVAPRTTSLRPARDTPHKFCQSRSTSKYRLQTQPIPGGPLVRLPAACGSHPNEGHGSSPAWPTRVRESTSPSRVARLQAGDRAAGPDYRALPAPATNALLLQHEHEHDRPRESLARWPSIPPPCPALQHDRKYRTAADVVPCGHRLPKN